MEIKNTKGKAYPPLIKDLVDELLKDDFVHFKILCVPLPSLNKVITIKRKDYV